jgi:hypothetical protein
MERSTVAGGLAMLGFRRVRRAKIPRAHRDVFERYGESVIQLMIAASFQRYGENVLHLMIGATPALQPKDLAALDTDQTMVENAALWLTERADMHSNREWRLEIVECSILIFVVCGVVIESGLAKLVGGLLGLGAR